MDEKSKHLLTRTEDRISFLYIEMAKVVQTDYSVEIVAGNTRTEIPITTINCLILGPGVTITHRAVANIANAGCSICWMGELGCTFYTYGEPATNSAKNLLHQMQVHEHKQSHIDVVHRMYNIRYPDKHWKSKTLEQLRGLEGLTVKECYTKCAEKYGVTWNGRTYKDDDFDNSDTVNQYITSLNHMLYSIIQAAIVTMGYSPHIGYIHTGKLNAFTFDVADLYKESITIPLAFELASQGSYNRRKALSALRDSIIKYKLMKRIPRDIHEIMRDNSSNSSIEAELLLWDGKNFVNARKNYSET